jgi:hypothetical protein
LHNNILEIIKKNLTAQFNPNKGIGIFLRFNSLKQNKGRLEEIKESNFELVSFSRTPKKEIFIGNVYSLGQLIWLENTRIDALVLSVNAKNCEIYEIDGNFIEKVSEIKNNISKTEKEFSRVYTPTANIATTHSTGGNIVDRNEERQLKLFMSHVTNYLSSSKVDLNKYEYLVVLFSNNLVSFIENEVNELISKNGNLIPVFMNISLHQPTDILRIVSIQIKELQKATKKESLEAARENYDYYCEGWSEITKACNMGQISTLFVKPTLTKAGYIDTKNMLIFTYPEKDTIKVDNILPWIIKSSEKQGGEIVILRGERFSNSSDIAARLRYAKKRQNKNNRKSIRTWIEDRNGKPAIVKGTKDLLRIKFSKEDEDLQEIQWDRFFNLLKKNSLLFIYDNEKDSRFCAFIDKT